MAGYALSGAAAGAAGALEDLLKQEFLKQIQRKQLEQQAARDSVGAELGRGNLDVSRGNLGMRQKEFDASQQPRTPEPLKPMAVSGRIVDPNTGKVIYEPPKEAPAAKPVVRVNPRTGKVEQLGEAPAGAHFVNEPAPPSQGPTHARYNIVQGSDADGKPALLRTNVDTGQVEVLPMPAGANFAKREQPATQDQSNLALYANRVEQADPILKTLEGSITKMNPLSFAAQLKADHPKLQSAEVQQYHQASRNFINAVLRRESGAVISPTEFSEAQKQYLPVPGNSPQVLAQKAENRRIVLENYKRSAGPAYKPMSAAPGAVGGAPKGGSDFRVVEIK